jgi:hypothetical protein
LPVGDHLLFMDRFCALFVLAAAAPLCGGCVHEQLSQRGGCWVKEVHTRLGDTREAIAACQPRPPAWSPDPVVRSVEDCLFNLQEARYQTAVSGEPKRVDWDAEARRCLGDSDKIALAQVQRLQSQLEGARAQLARLEHDNGDLRKTLVACVEKTPTAVANASATTDSKSDAGGIPVGTEPRPRAVHAVAGHGAPPPATKLSRATAVEARATPAQCDCSAPGTASRHAP